ncbi:MAG: carboxymuconolactone decarboxylase family protein [Verrucomicrobiota bacterium]|jgi:uncharacterized peroxidase-related enzyme
MLRLSPVEPKQVSKELRGIWDGGQNGFEEVPTFLKILARSPAAALAYGRVSGALARGRLSAQEREQIALAVAEINGSNYCLRAHTAQGRICGLTEEEIEYSRRAAAPEPKAAQMLRFTQLIVLQRGEISDEDLGALRKAGFTDEEAIEIVANIALNIFTNYLNILSKTAGDFPAIADGPPESLLRESTQAPA